MLTQLIAALQKTRLDMTAAEIADMLWLASHLKTTQKEIDTHPAETSSQEYDGTIVSEEDITETDTHPSETSFQDHNETRSAKQTISSPPNVDVYPTTSQSDVQSDIKGFLFRSPAASALPNTLLIARSLRPLMRRLPSKTQFVLNQQATVQRIAETDQRIWAPVLDPLPTRRFDIELVVDEGASMLLWQQVMIEWRALLEHHGAFRNVRIWRLTTNDHEYVQLYAGTMRRQDRPHDPKELIDPSGRRLILVMTDCVSPAWHSGKVQSLLDIWGHKNLVSLIQVFPRRLWQQTALANADLIQIDALLRHISNSQLTTHAPVQRFDKDLSPEDGFAYPIVTLEAKSLHNWARIITGIERTWIPGIIFTSDEVDTISEDEATPQHVPLSPVRRLQLFHANASFTARKLIELLAAVPIPINLQIIRLIQRTMVPEASQVHIAEVLLSGLLEEIYRDPAGSDFNNIEYDFVAGVRDELLNAIAISTVHQVLREISSFVERYQGKARDFLALITMPDRMDQGVFITHESRPFAQIASTVLRRYGGDFAAIAKKLEQQIHLLNTRQQVETENVLHLLKQGTLLRQYDVHISWVVAVAWEPSGTRIASAGEDGTVHVWEAETGQSLLAYRGHIHWPAKKDNYQITVYTISWNPEGDRIVSAGFGTDVHVWNAATGQTLTLYQGHSGLFPYVFAVAWSPDGMRMASACSSMGQDKTLHLWNPVTGKPLSRYDIPSGGWMRNFAVLSVAWSPDGTRIAATCDDKFIRVWNTETGHLVSTYRFRSEYVRHIAWSPDSRYLASAHTDRTAQIWDMFTGTNVTIYNGHTDTVRYVAWSPNGTSLATASNDRTVHIWEPLTGKCIYIYRGHSDWTTSVAWSPDGTRIASASNDKTVHIWQASALIQ